VLIVATRPTVGSIDGVWCFVAYKETGSAINKKQEELKSDMKRLDRLRTLSYGQSLQLLNILRRLYIHLILWCLDPLMSHMTTFPPPFLLHCILRKPSCKCSVRANANKRFILKLLQVYVIKVFDGFTNIYSARPTMVERAIE